MICDCCGLEAKRLSRRYWTKNDAVCNDCLYIWYDTGITDKATIKRLRSEGWKLTKQN